MAASLTLAAAGPSETPNMLRHAAVCTLANEGVDTKQDFLGHADIRHAAHYTPLSPRRLAAVRVR
jgi:site-specific recombinase XerD